MIELKIDNHVPGVLLLQIRSALRMCGALVEIDEQTGRAISIERIEVQGENAEQAYDADDKVTPAPPSNG